MGLSRNIATRYPCVSGLVAGSTSQTGHIENLVPEETRKAASSCNITDFPVNSLLLESNDFILLETGDTIEAE